MHILVVASGMPSARYPMMGIFEWDQAKALSEAGAEVDYFSIDLRSFRRIRPWGIRHGRQNGIRWHSISIPVGAVPISFLSEIGAKSLQILYRTVFGKENHAPHLMHAHFAEIGYMASKLAIAKNIPLVITEHSSLMIKETITDEWKRIVLKGYRCADRVLAVSTSLKVSIHRHTGIVAEVMPNIVSDTFQCKRCAHAGMRFISVASLNYGKRMDVLLRAFAQLPERYSEVVLEIVGDGEQREKLEKLAEELHISGQVKFHGILLRQNIESLYKICDCFVLPSAFETFGVVYIEAMAAGLPVIATRCGGPEDFVTEENGILVDVDDVNGLRDAMLAMCWSRRKYNSELISATTKRQFSSSVIARRLLGVYEDVLEKRK